MNCSFGEIPVRKVLLLVGTIISFLFIGCESQRQVIDRISIVPGYSVDVPNKAEVIEQANANNPIAQYQLAGLYYDGIGMPKNEKMALGWYLKSANNGYAPAQYSAGWLYFYGKGGIRTDFVEGCKWLRLASAQGIAEANRLMMEKCSMY